MNFLSDIITYVRRIIKSPSDAQITDNLIIDYINRFWLMDVDARMQLFDLKTTYKFQTTPGVDQYNMPLYSIQVEPGAQNIGLYPVYQGFTGNAYVNGVQTPLQTDKSLFFLNYPNIVQNISQVATGDGTATYNFTVPVVNNSTPVNPPVSSLLRGHVDMSGIVKLGTNDDPPLADTITLPFILANVPTTSISPAVYITATDDTGSNVVVTDSGVFLSTNINYGMLISPGNAPYGHSALGIYSTTANTINYLTGEVNVTFPVNIPSGVTINAQVYYFQTGLPRSILYYNNVLTLRPPPSQQWLVELDAYLSPAAFLATSNAVPFAYMSEYIARGAARKILADVGDVEQFAFYEPLFKEQELLVWKRSQRQFTATRTPTIYSQGNNFGWGYNNYGGGFSR